MESERNTERIIDLLYGELSNDESSELRGELSAQPELRAEHDELASMLEEIRSALPEVEVPSHVQQSILAAARNAAAEDQERRKVIPPQRPVNRGLWQRMTRGKGGQIALVATVLIAGAFVTRFVKLSDSRMEQMAQAEAKIDVPLVPAADKAAGPPSPAPAPSAPVEEVKKEVAALGLEGRGSGSSQDSFGAQTEARRRKSRKTAEPKPRTAVSKKRAANKPDGLVDSLLSGVRSGGGHDRSIVENAPAVEREQSYVEPQPKQSAANDDSDLEKGRLFEENEPVERDAPANYEESSDESESENAEVVEAKSKKANSKAAPTHSLGEVERRFASGNNTDTIRAADAFVESGEGSQTEQARALELKAQALAKSGRHRESQQVYETILAQYPSYQPTKVANARKRARKRAAASAEIKAQKASEAKSAPTKAEEPAY